MKLILLTLSLLTSVELYALPIAKPLMQRFMPKTDEATSTQCADFSGHWKGICTVDGQSPTAENAEITQNGCSYIVSNSQAIYLGGTTNVSNAFALNGKTYTSAYTVAADWNEAKTKVLLQVIGNGREMEKSGLFALGASGALELVGKQLKMQMKLEDFKVDCTFDKY